MEPGVWQALSASAIAVPLRQSDVAYLFVNAAHIASLGFLIGSVTLLDLHLLGAIRALPLARLGPLLSRAAAIGLLCAATTGAWLFTVNAPDYVVNPAFQAKLALLALAVLNAACLHRRDWTVEPMSRMTRLQGGLSLALWLGVLLAGRWIAFA